MRFTKRRDHATRPATKTDGIILFQNNSQNWRERVKALKAAQNADQTKSDAEIKHDRA